MSLLYMRMHPCETNPPIEPGLFVPWIAYCPPPLSVIAAAPIGFAELPLEMTFGMRGFSRLIMSGGDQAGFMNIPSM